MKNLAVGSSQPDLGVSRRHLLIGAGSAAGLAALSPVRAGTSPQRSRDETLTTPADAVATTTYGKVRGFKRSSVYIFKGIPFGADTGGSARFLPPKPPKSWDEVRLSLLYGPVCPQRASNFAPTELLFVNDAGPAVPDENCLSLNVWSETLDHGARRPVIVWLHGGGFTSGSSHELPVYDGENLARQGVVLVSVNHRLGALGFLDLSAAGGEEFAQSGNVGMLDLVFALKWVRDNAVQFGGDPDRITIFGHSGGGGKVSTLMAMPAAQGLFHRAIVTSGSFPNTTRPANSQELTAATLAELGLKPADRAELQRIDAARLINAGDAASRKLMESARGRGARSGVGPMGMQFGPVIDGQVLPEAWLSSAPGISAGVPMIVGNVRDEFRPLTLHVDEPKLAESIPEKHRDQAPKIIAALRAAYPNLPATDLAAILGAIGMRNMAVDQATKKYELRAAPVYSYWYTLATPVLDGRIGCPHGMDLPAAFDNTVRCDQFTGNTPEAQHVARLLSKAIVNFATSGNPSQPGLAWAAFDSQRLATMVFDAHTRLEYDPIGDVRRWLS
jgi:para-nitrobenzyl esterase